MKLTLVAVGEPSALLAEPIRAFEARAGRYWKLEVVEVGAEKASRNRPVAQIREAEAERLLGAVPERTDIVALTREGSRWSSTRLARYCQELAVGSAAGAAFVIGGAYGLAPSLLSRARHRLSLSPMTLPHDLARLVLVEQIYRAGTILRNEPYHKG